MATQRRVLVVAAGSDRSTAIVRDLGAHGWSATTCPGPCAPDYVCVGIRTGVCPLTADADAVVLDGWLESDRHRRGTPSWHLARFYWGQGLPVVYLVGPDGLVAGITNERLVALPPSADGDEIAETLEHLTA